MSFFQQLFSCFCGKKTTSNNKIIKEIVYVPPKMVILKKSLPQQFSLPKPILRYLIQEADVKNVKKFQQTCKYFLAEFNFSIIDSLSIVKGGMITFFNSSIRIPANQIDFFRNDLYLTGSLSICSRSNNLEKFCQKILISDINVLILSEKIALSDFILITLKSKNLKRVKIYSYIYFSNGAKVPLEDILQYIPNVDSFTNLQCIITPTTMTKLFSIKRNVKFYYLWLIGISNSFDPLLFNDYIKNMFEFECLPSSIELIGDPDTLEQIYELVKTWRKNSCFFEDNCLYIR